MTLHLNEAERAAYRREKNRQYHAAYVGRQAEKAWQREQRYQQIEQRIAEVHEENERIKSGYERMRQQYEALRADPPERIVEKVVIEKVPVRVTVTSLTDVLALIREAAKEGMWHWIDELQSEIATLRTLRD